MLAFFMTGSPNCCAAGFLGAKNEHFALEAQIGQALTRGGRWFEALQLLPAPAGGYLSFDNYNVAAPGRLARRCWTPTN
jgi:hypothetical protein